MMQYKCLSIAGFDGSGGAGIQADLKTFSATGSYGLTILTAIPIQNTCGIRKCYPLPLYCIEDQLHSIFEDITPDAIKLGMLFSIEVIELVAEFLKKKTAIPIILDPVMMAKSKDFLIKKEAIAYLKKLLIPMANLITPNLPEASTLVPGKYKKIHLAKKLLDLGCKAVLLKGGHERNSTSEDLFMSHEATLILSSKRIKSKNTHGTGCTLSAAIASFVAQGYPYPEACEKAKSYLYKALSAAQNICIGKGHGPVHHFFYFDKKAFLQNLLDPLSNP